ncbi:MAG: hypothetical protein PUC71_03515 [Oscillospiraceae bacterium]|nr:hypothetical protein [Oscillospiraceae bacterium]
MKKFENTGLADSYQKRAEAVIREGNEYIRAHQDENYVSLLEKDAEFEARCKALHGYFRKDPDVKDIMEEKSREYQMEQGTRFSPRHIDNRFLNYNGKYPTEKW